MFFDAWAASGITTYLTTFFTRFGATSLIPIFAFLIASIGVFLLYTAAKAWSVCWFCLNAEKVNK